jgi:hypothetical protein
MGWLVPQKRDNLSHVVPKNRLDFKKGKVVWNENKDDLKKQMN